MGSVKDLVVIEKPKDSSCGLGKFVFSDRFSVFDWGKMPDEIPLKGRSLCIMGAFFFEKLEENSYKTHYIGLVEDGKIKRLDELKEPSAEMVVKLVRVIKPKVKDHTYDYSEFKNLKANFLIPFEVIYRNSLPEGSSVFKRLREGKLSPSDLGLEYFPEPGVKLPDTFIELSTKLEEIDRYISWEEAKELTGIDESVFDEIKKKAVLASKLITEFAQRADISNEDGKFEFALDEKGELMFVDVLGTPDECRFTKDGFHISKEILRVFYRKTEWFYELEEAKKRDKINWRKLVRTPPPRLPEELKKLVSLMYLACCNEITGREWFKGVPTLQKVINEIRSFLDSIR